MTHDQETIFLMGQELKRADEKLGICIAALVSITTLDTLGKDRETAWTALEKIKSM